MPNPRQDHWQRVYRDKAIHSVSWYQQEAAPSLAMIQSTGLGADAALIDVGAGPSTLVDGLLDRNFSRITLLDISEQALVISKERLGPRAQDVDWLVADITTWTPPDLGFDLWHDRAVFHFLTEEADRQAYVRTLTRALRPEGYLILAPFALAGPERCSGLPVQRHSPETLQAVLGASFQLVSAKPQTHRTPAGAEQDFVWCLFRKAQKSER